MHLNSGPKKATCVNKTWQPSQIVRKCIEQTHTPMEEVEWEKMPGKLVTRNKRLIKGLKLISFTLKVKLQPLKPVDEPVSGACHPLLPDNKRFFANIRLNPDETGKYPSGSSVLVQCRQGYRLKAPENSHVTCYDKTWIPKPSVCVPSKTFVA